MMIQASLATAFHPQPAPAKTLTLPLPPSEVNEAAGGDIE
jgi:hypothetical protein